MRVICSVTGSPSHGRAMLPLARALATAGHDVLVATTPDLPRVFADDGLRVVTCLPGLREAVAKAAESGGVPGGGPAPATDEEWLAHAVALMTGPIVTAGYEALLPVAREFRPDLVLRDGMELSSVLVAERLGLPHLPVPSGALNMTPPEAVLPGLNARRADAGLPTTDDPASVVPHGRIDYVPDAFSFARHDVPARAYRQQVTVDRVSVLPAWAAELPTGKPLVFAAVGTALPMIAQIPAGAAPLPEHLPDPAAVLRALIEGLSDLDCTAVVATAGLEAEGVSPAPHVRLTDWVPQPLFLEAVDLFVTHGGFNSVRESMRTATPLAVMPYFGDQPRNADRVQELGLGRRVPEHTGAAVADTCRAVLGDGHATERARAARLAMLALPDIGQAVTDLEKLTA